MRKSAHTIYNQPKPHGLSCRLVCLLLLLILAVLLWQMSLGRWWSADNGGTNLGEYKSEWPQQFTPDSEGLFFWLRYQDELRAAAEEIRVAVYSTHSAETYTDFAGAAKVFGEHGGVYVASSALAERMLAAGCGVYVDETIHDWPDWNKSYANSRQTAENLLAEYPKLQLLIDMHRDAGVSRENSVTQINGRSAARIMLVVGSAQRYENPNWQQNQALMQQIGDKMEEMYPGLLRRVSVQSGRYNQDLFTGAILVEMGTTENTINEVEYSAQLLADVLLAVLEENSEKYKEEYTEENSAEE